MERKGKRQKCVYDSRDGEVLNSEDRKQCAMEETVKTEERSRVPEEESQAAEKGKTGDNHMK